MATLNYAFKEISCKIVYYGCGLCGKTTNLIHVHKTVPGKFRGELVSLATEQDRTLFFDFLPLDLGEVKGFKTKFQLYTVPGQVYYNATRKLVLRGVDGIVFVADSQRDRLQENLESLENLKQNLAEYGYHLQDRPGSDDDGVPWILQLNKRDMPQISTKEEIVEALSCDGIPTVEAVAVTGVGVKETLKGISSLVIQKLNTGGGALSGGSSSKSAAPAASAAASAPAAQDDDDEYGAIEESDLTDEALEAPQPPKAAPPAPAPAPAAKEPTPAPTPAAAEQQKSAAPASSGPPTLNISQRCDGRWRGMKTGSGNLTIANISGSTEYQLTGVLSFMGVFKRTWSKKLIFKGSEMKNYEGQDTSFFHFESTGGQEGPMVNVWVQDSIEKSLFARYLGFGGEVAVLPEGKKDTP
ncbi:GTPase domain-containing protein [bacterium]|nr:GTPase domain-containing protein [bacterium]